MRMFAERDIPITVFGAALALERNPDAAAAIRAAGYEVCSHGWRWIGFQNMAEDEEREQKGYYVVDTAQKVAKFEAVAF